MVLHKAVFLDRDGVINQDTGYIHRVEDFSFIDGVFEVCRAYQDAGYKIIIVTNQSGIARGYFEPDDFTLLNQWMLNQFKQNAVHITGVYHCPHHPSAAIAEYRKNCECRKPQPGMLLRAMREHNIDPDISILFGDKLSDIVAARAANIKHAILVRSGQALSEQECKKADAVYDKLTYITP